MALNVAHAQVTAPQRASSAAAKAKLHRAAQDTDASVTAGTATSMLEARRTHHASTSATTSPRARAYRGSRLSTHASAVSSTANANMMTTIAAVRTRCCCHSSRAPRVSHAAWLAGACATTICRRMVLLVALGAAQPSVPRGDAPCAYGRCHSCDERGQPGKSIQDEKDRLLGLVTRSCLRACRDSDRLVSRNMPAQTQSPN